MTNNDTYNKLITLLDQHHAKYRLIDHDPEGKTDLVSKMRGNTLSQAVKCMVMVVHLSKKETKYVLGVIPGDKQIDFDAIKHLMNASYVSFAPKHITEELAQSVVGTVLPFPFHPDLEMLVDPLILANEEIFFNAGRLDRSIALNTKDYIAIAKPRLESITRTSTTPQTKKSDGVSLVDLRHSTAHLLAAAVMNLWPNTKRAIGPAIDTGFYFDFDFGDVKISESDFPKIEKEMGKIIQSWKEFTRIELSVDDAKKEYPDNQYKQELIEEFEKEKQALSFYKSGNYSDLCKGGHVKHPCEEIKHFKLLSVAGAYWRGNEKNPMLTRIYGTVFPTKEELDHYLWQLDEAKKRDHRKLGAELELFFIDEMVGKGLVMWLPKGTIIRDEIEKLAREKERQAGYERVVTPHIAREELFTTSGHLPYYKDSMYPPMKMDDGNYYLKAMNCPYHHRIFLHKPRSYKELPLRLAEYGTCYRNELSGTLAGLLRVRALSMNDAHIYCTKDQIKNEFKAVLELTMDYFTIFGLKNFWFRLSKWDPHNREKYIDEPQNWDFTQKVLKDVMEELKLPFKEVDNEAAFYGPKVDVQFTSIIGREETMSTIQLDFAAKNRFGFSYTDSTGMQNREVFVIHRAPLSVHERFLAFLLEHYAGAFPLWLSPVQIKLIPIADRHVELTQKIYQKLCVSGIRAELDSRPESMQSKIRDASLQKIPFTGIIGDKEVEASYSNGDKLVLSVRKRNGEARNGLDLDFFIKELIEEIEKKR